MERIIIVAVLPSGEKTANASLNRSQLKDTWEPDT